MAPLPFHPLVVQWFAARFGEPTEAQRLGWPSIAAGEDTLIAAPTGSGKTLAAFLAAIDRLLREAVEGRLADDTRVLYVSPLKALSHDIQRNLIAPLEEIAALAEKEDLPPIRAAVRTGDTPASERRRMIRRPPHLLITTPESLYLLLTSDRGRAMLSRVETVIVDEIHAVARDKRGSHLALSLARLDALCAVRPARIGLSATQRPMDEIARFLVGADRTDADGRPRCAIVDVGHRRDLDLGVVVPPSELSAVCSNEQWEEIYGQVADLIAAHRSTIVFVNTRRMAERVTLRLSERLGEASVLSHHGSLSKTIRHHTEQQLKQGAIKAVVATASLELGIDIGFIDLVVQIGSPRSIAVFLQRVGRSGHALGRVPKGRLVPLTRDELMECAALLRALTQGVLDRIDPPEAPLDILAQQIVAETACREWPADELFALCRRAWPYRGLSRERFDDVVGMLNDGFAARFGRTGAYVHYDRVGGRVKGRRGARLTALTSGGAIPELADYRVVAEPDQTVVGSVDEDFAVESLAGDVFLLGNTSWRVRHVRGGDVLVTDAHGAPPSIPFWRGEAPARTRELSDALSDLRRELTSRVSDPEAAAAWLVRECLLDASAARQLVHYAAAQLAAMGVLPTRDHLVIERFFDESGGMQIVLHAPCGGHITRAWGLALRKRLCRTFDFELQSSADDNGLVLSLGPQQSFALDTLTTLVPASQAEPILVQAVLAAPIFTTRWRWNANRALAVPRQRHGKKVPPPLQRMRADDLLTAVFPQQTACRENMTEPDIPVPDHPLVRQTLHDCLHEAADLGGLVELLEGIETGRIRWTALDTREPSPFAYEILNAAPYAFLDDAPLEERRARAVATRRTLPIESLRDLGALDPEAIERVTAEAWPLVRDADELYDALMLIGLVTASEGAAWATLFDELAAAHRVVTAADPSGHRLWVAIERWPAVRLARPDIEPVQAPEAIASSFGTREEADVELVRGRVEVSGPVTAGELAATVGLPVPRIEAALAALEHQGFVLRGRFRPRADETEWCARRLLARIHRLTLDRLRREIEPVPLTRFADFLFAWQHLTPATRTRGRDGLRDVIRQLQGFELPAVAWERAVLPARIDGYEPRWLDECCLGGEVAWGRIAPRPGGGERTQAATRNVPITLMEREHAARLRRAAAPPAVSPRARGVWEALKTRGASFTQELAVAAHLLPAELDRALWELVAAGLVTQDGFAPIRALGAGTHRGRPRPRSAPRGHGRWSLTVEPAEDNTAPQWASLLLDRYGVVFRDLLAREHAAPPWHRLVPQFRAMETRGEIRGGRFVAQVGGEQYARPSAVEQLRRAVEPSTDPICVSAVDPANLTALFPHGPRVRTHPTNTVAFVHGACVGIRQGNEQWIDENAPDEVKQKVQAALRGSHQLRQTPR